MRKFEKMRFTRPATSYYVSNYHVSVLNILGGNLVRVTLRQFVLQKLNIVDTLSLCPTNMTINYKLL